MDQPHAFDEQALARWLAVELPGIEGPLRVERFKNRQSTPTYKLIITPGRSCVMRAKPGQQARLLPSAHTIEREYRVMDAWPSAACQLRACTCCGRTNR